MFWVPQYSKEGIFWYFFYIVGDTPRNHLWTTWLYSIIFQCCDSSILHSDWVPSVFG